MTVEDQRARLFFDRNGMEILAVGAVRDQFGLAVGYHAANLLQIPGRHHDATVEARVEQSLITRLVISEEGVKGSLVEARGALEHLPAAKRPRIVHGKHARHGRVRRSQTGAEWAL